MTAIMTRNQLRSPPFVLSAAAGEIAGGAGVDRLHARQADAAMAATRCRSFRSKDKR